MIYKTNSNDTVDWIAWKTYGFTKTSVEKLLKTNPNLSEYDDFLPENLSVILPEIDAKESTKRINLWD